MKKKICTLVILSLAVASLTACNGNGNGSQDTGVLVTAGDNNVDTTGTAKTVSEDSAEPTQTTNTPTEVADNTSAPDEDTIIGNWASDNGDAFQFNSDNSVECIIINEDLFVVGTYETDWNTYLTIKYTEDAYYDESIDDAYDDIYNSDEYKELAEDKTSYIWLRENSAYIETVNVDDEGHVIILDTAEDVKYDITEIEEFAASKECRTVMIGYDDEWNIIGKAPYDPATDITNIYYNDDTEATVTPTPEEPKEVSITYELIKGRTEYNEMAIQLIKDNDTIDLIKR